jgi:hypothetical protein
MFSNVAMTHPANEYQRTMPAAGMGFKRSLAQRAIDIVEPVTYDGLIVGRASLACRICGRAIGSPKIPAIFPARRQAKFDHGFVIGESSRNKLIHRTNCIDGSVRART